MKKRLIALLMATIMCIGLLPEIGVLTDLARLAPAYAAALSLQGGNKPDCIHANTTRNVTNLDSEYHRVRLDCPDCGGWAEYDESHTWVEAYEITPGNPDGTFPNGGTHYKCNTPGCTGEKDVENTSASTHVHNYNTLKSLNAQQHAKFSLFDAQVNALEHLYFVVSLAKGFTDSLNFQKHSVPSSCLSNE